MRQSCRIRGETMAGMILHLLRLQWRILHLLLRMSAPLALLLRLHALLHLLHLLHLPWSSHSPLQLPRAPLRAQ